MKVSHAYSKTEAQEGSLSQRIVQHNVLRNTYALLAMTLLFSAVIATLSMSLNLPHPGITITLIGYFGLLFLTHKYRNQSHGLVFVFVLTGFMGMTLGPILNNYWILAPQIVLKALGLAAIVFLGLSTYAIKSQKSFSFLGSFVFIGILVAFLCGFTAIFMEIPALSLGASAMFVLLMSGLILYQTSEIFHGGETNYINATVTLYVSVYNMFTSLLHLFGFAQPE